jgi:hypothetical protein
MAKFWIGLLSGIFMSMLFFERFPGGASEGMTAIEQQIKASTP